jgi:3-methylcrotonyl-CoA carboxylase alpha subunit
MGRMIRRVLVANRGEIAVRIIRACHQLGLEAVAVHSEPDARALHVRLADEAMPLRGRTAAETYLDISQILAAASAARVDAIHPGYGFLSENDDFAMLVQNSGFVFIGPKASTIALMGDKSAAKDIMEKAGVPVVPGYSGFDQSDERLRVEAQRIEPPVLIKAAHGGGGKGMRLVEDLSRFQEAVEAARRESMAAFGSERLLLERHLKPVRHIEVQILGDQFGKCVHLLERECSIQRRHQKIIEECPSPMVTDELRQRLGAAALLAAQAVSYSNAGTVEFLVDEAGAFYFLEMNTRLQVEHPVTEWVTGVDLVHQQLHVASGRPLELRQSDIRPRGHAIEARVYAEDPAAGFSPSVGTVTAVQEPVGPGIRVDSCLFPGQEVSMFYDALLAKVTAYGWTRLTAIENLDWALARLLICGIVTNVPYLRAILAQSSFHAGDTSTDFLATHLPDWQPEPPPLEVVLAAALHASSTARSSSRFSGETPAHVPSPWTRLSGFRTGTSLQAGFGAP